MGIRYKNRSFSILMIVPLLFTSCSEDIELNTNSKPIPLVYCIFNPQDSIYRVLLSKTFSGDSSAFQMAQNPNYLYFKEASITMEAWNSDRLIWETEFHPNGITRDSGLFSSLPGFAFETRDVLSSYFGFWSVESLSGIDWLRLVIRSPEIEEPAYARIRPYFGKPQIDYPYYKYKVFNLCDTVPYYLEFNTSQKAYYDLRCKFRYVEFTDQSISREIDFTIKSNLRVGNGKFQQKISPDLFFRRLAASFPPDNPDVIYRTCTSLDIILVTGSENFKTYMDTYYTDNDQGYTLWNCFHGGIGLFAQSGKTALEDLIPDKRTLDSLADGGFTRHLRFRKL